MRLFDISHRTWMLRIEKRAEPFFNRCFVLFANFLSFCVFLYHYKLPKGQLCSFRICARVKERVKQGRMSDDLIILHLLWCKPEIRLLLVRFETDLFWNADVLCLKSGDNSGCATLCGVWHNWKSNLSMFVLCINKENRWETLFSSSSLLPYYNKQPT